MMRWKAKAALGIAGITLLAATAWSVYSAGLRAGEARTRALWDAEVAMMAQAQAEELMKARQRERALEALVKQQREDHRRETNRIAREFAALSDSLRDRPEARAGGGGVPESPDAGAGSAPRCTGAELYRQDSEFLAREAARADQLRIALNACIAHADAVERELNGASRVE